MKKHFVSTSPGMEVHNAWKGAKEKGKIASLCEVAKQRIFSLPIDPVWGHVNTKTFEYCGFYKGKHLLVVVSHDVGAVNNLKSYRDSTIATNTLDYGRISQKEFDDLVSEKNSEVHTLDLKEYSRKNDYPFTKQMTVDELINDELFGLYFSNNFEYLGYLDEKLGGARFSFEQPGEEGVSLFRISKMLGSNILSTPIVRMLSLPAHLSNSKDVLLKEKINYLRPAFVGLYD